MRKEWPTQRLGDVCEIIMGQSPESESHNTTGEGVPLINGPVEFSAESFGKTVRTKFTTQPTKFCKEGDLILCVRGSATGRMNIAGFDACVGRGVAAIRAKQYQPWINYFISLKRDEIHGKGTGATFPNVSGDSLANFKLAVPPLPEQRRIVGILDEAFEGLARATANAEQNLRNARALFESHLQSVFAEGGKDWVAHPLCTLCKDDKIITYGVIQLGTEIPDGVPCLRTSNVRWLRIDTKGIKRIDPALSTSYSRTILEGGEVLVNVRGTLGGVGVASSEMHGWNVPREVAVAPVDPTKVNPRFAAYCIGSGIGQEWLGGMKKGATYVGINIEDLRNLPVHAPSLIEQEELVKHLDACAVETQRLESIYQQKLAALGELKKSLLHQAFSGAL